MLLDYDLIKARYINFWKNVSANCISDNGGIMRGISFIKILICCAIFIFSFRSDLLAANLRDVVINEIAWMGTNASSYDEWIELFNNTSSTISLAGWTLSAADGTPSITLSGEIGPYGYFLLERTDDSTVSDITADQIYTGALEDGGEDLLLKDNNDNIIDRVDCSSGWFAGDGTDKITMERIDSLSDGSASSNWANNDGITVNGEDADGNPLNGTAKAKNSVTDSTPPASITDLVALPGIGEGEINLTWTAPGDDGSIGQVTSYTIKYNTNQITSANWESSTVFLQSWVPQSAGIIEWHTITGLTPGITYYFAIKSKDEANNESGISNSPSSIAQYSDAVLFNEIAPSESNGSDIIEIYVKKEANCAGAKVYENANAQGSELIKTFPTTGDWAGVFPAGTYIVLRLNNTSADETEIGVDKVINIYSTDTGLTATDNLLFLGNIEGLKFSNGAYQSGKIVDFVAWANQDQVSLTEDYRAGINAAVNAGQWTKIGATPIQFDCVNSRGCYTSDRGLARDQYSTDNDSKFDWSYRTSLSIGAVNSPPTTYQGQGEGSISPADTVIVNTTGTWTITYTAANPNNDNVCHMVTIEIPQGWTLPQTIDPYSAGYVTTTYSFASGYGVTVSSRLVILPVGNMSNGDIINVEYRNAVVQADTGVVTFIISSDETGTNVGEIEAGSPSLVVSDDTTPPAAITDLSSVTGTAEGTIVLSWTSPGDDGSIGQASAYIVRYSTTGIIETDTQFDLAMDYPNNWVPLSAGEKETHIVEGLKPGITYWFAIKTQDEVPNTSTISNSPFAPAYNSPPSAPLNLKASVSYQTVDLSWDSNTEPDLAGYNIYRSTLSGVNYTKLNTSLLLSTTYHDTGLVTGNTYYYVVTAVDNTELESEYSTEVSAVPPDLIPPDGAIVISEIMYDPGGIEPDEEWIEIYNRSDSTVDLSSCTFSDGEGSYIFPQKTYLNPDSYLVLGYSQNSANGSVDLVYGEITGESLSLANTDDEVIIKNKQGDIVDIVAYTSDWGAANGTGSDNFTLQRKDMDASSQERTNWGQSLDQGGTPGAPNNTDTIPPVIEHTPISKAYAGQPIHIHAKVTDNQPWYTGNVKLYYRRTGGTTSYTEVQMTGTLDEYSGTIPSEDVTMDGVEYYIWAMDDYNNIATAPLTAAATSPYQITVVQNPYALVINEIMYDPAQPEPDYEWVELYNATSTALDISSWTFSNLNATYVIPEGTIIPGYGYFVLGYSSSAAGGNVDLVYGLDSQGQDIQFSNILASVSDSVIIKDTEGIVVDEVPYSSHWGAHNFTGPNNNSLERLMPSGPSSEQSNWLHSNIKGGTPKAKNSSHMIRNVIIAPEIFNPVRGSTATITYDLVWEYDMESDTTTVEIKIYNSSGVLVRSFIDIKYSSGTYSQVWDGKDENGEIVLGINTVEIIGTNGSIVCTHNTDDRAWFDYGGIIGYMGDYFEAAKGEVGILEVSFSKPVVVSINIEDSDHNILNKLSENKIVTESALILWDGRNSLGQLIDLNEYQNIYTVFLDKPEGHILATINPVYLYDVNISTRSAFNPENGEKISLYYSISGSASVNIKVYREDTGEFIETLFDGVQEAGSYSVIWDGKDENNQPYDDGTYLIVIKVDSQSITREIALRSY